MHVVIPLAEEPKNETLELALRTIEAHTHLDVIVAGWTRSYEDHPFVHGHMVVEQYRGQQVRNTDAIMRAACLEPGISDPFVWSNDDIFWRRRVSLVELVVEQSTAMGMLKAVEEKGLHGRLSRVTGRILDQRGFPSWNYERHVPMTVHKAQMLEALELGGQKRSAYLNMLIDQPTHVEADVKLHKLGDEEMMEAGKPFFSTGPGFPIETIRGILGL